MKHVSWHERLILRLTHRLWNREISRILGLAYEHGWINSKQLHDLCSRFDPTQEHQIAYVPEKASWHRWPSGQENA